MKNRISIAIAITGFSGIAAQLLLLRELLIVFTGNEFSIGIVLANWLLLEAFGCYFLGKKAEKVKNKIIVYTVITALFALSLPLMVFLTRILRNILDLSIGEGMGILPILYSSFFILLPVSVLHGALFTFGCKVYAVFSEHNAKSIGKAYIYEIIGTMIGGLSWTYLLIPYFHSFQIAFGLAIINFLVCCYLMINRLPNSVRRKLPNQAGASPDPTKKQKRSALRSASMIERYSLTTKSMKTPENVRTEHCSVPTQFSGQVMLIIPALLTLFASYYLISGRVDNLHKRSIVLQWKGQNIVHYQNSIYGNIAVMEVDNQYTFFLDGIPHITTPIPDIVSVEEFVHLPLLTHPNPEKLLILSGGAGGIINEILKHQTIKSVDYTELDPLVPELLRKFPTDLTETELTDQRVKVSNIDGRLFLQTTDRKYDVVFVGLREPSDLQANRFFTKEFFSLVNERLLAPGLIAISLPGSLTYLNEELKDLNSSLYHTMVSVFPYVRVIPGEGTNIFLASNSQEVTLIDMQRFTDRFTERELQAERLIPWHIEYKLNPGWVDWFHDFIEDASDKINYDFKPIALYYSISYWNTIFTPVLSGFFRWAERISLGYFLALLILFAVYIMLFKTGKKQRPVAELRSAKDEPVAELRSAKDEPVAELRSAKDEPVAELRSAKDEPVAELRSAKDEPVAELRSAKDEPVAELRSAKVPFRSGIIFSIGTTGFAGMMFDLVLIFAFQAIYGYVFSWIGLLVTFFMAGSAVGAVTMTAKLPKIKNNFRLFIILEVTIIAFTLILPLIFILLQPYLDRAILFHNLKYLFLPLSFFSGFTVGIQFPLANKIYLHSESNLSKTAGLFYGSDLIGGWLGGILGSVFLLPVLGLFETCLFVVLLKLSSLLVIAVSKAE